MEAEREEPRVVKLRAVEATPESFAPFGQVIAASPDGDQFGPHDAQLDLSRGIPRSVCHNPLQIPISPAPANHPPPLFPGPDTQIVTFPP
jgi:hypothetical protein